MYFAKLCDEDKLDSEFAKLYDEEKRLNEKLHLLLEQNNMENITQSKIKNIFSEIESEKLELKEFDDILNEIGKDLENEIDFKEENFLSNNCLLFSPIPGIISKTLAKLPLLFICLW